LPFPTPDAALVEWERKTDFADETVARNREAAWKEIYVAEGSDWFWWYGDDHKLRSRQGI